jgi:hypothetical protein
VAGCIVCPDDRPETLAGALREVLDRGGRINGRAAVADLDERELTARVIEIYAQALMRLGRGRRTASVAGGGA